MDLLNNLNTVISVIVGLVTIGGSIFGVIKHLQKRVISSQTNQTRLLSPSSKPSTHDVEPKLLSWLDWWEVCWKGLEDSFKAKNGEGWIPSFIVGFVGIFILSDAVSRYNSIVAIICLVVFIVLWFTVNLLFYTYFVGRRVEEKVKEITSQTVEITQHP